jgi:nucleoid-associated protein YgaU
MEHEPLAPNPHLARYRQRLASVPPLLWVSSAVLLLAAVAIGYFLLRGPERNPSAPAADAEGPPAAIAEPEPVVEAPPEIPAPAAEPAVPLPALDESDAEVASALTESFGPGVAEQYLRPESLIRNLVVTVDNLSRTNLALDRRPLQATPGVFVAGGSEDAYYLSEENYARYTPFTTLLARTEARTIVALYRRYYPLMQQAYVDLGNPEPVFNTRVVEVIDHLLATPEVAGPIPLVQPNVLYQFKDPALERLSSGQKILLRMGPEYAAIVKTKLREIRAELAAAAP